MFKNVKYYIVTDKVTVVLMLKKQINSFLPQSPEGGEMMLKAKNCANYY